MFCPRRKKEGGARKTIVAVETSEQALQSLQTPTVSGHSSGGELTSVGSGISRDEGFECGMWLVDRLSLL